jgi:hypothetical protein
MTYTATSLSKRNTGSSGSPQTDLLEMTTPAPLAKGHNEPVPKLQPPGSRSPRDTDDIL